MRVSDIREAGSIPVLGRYPGGGCGNPLQYSCLENPVVRGAWRATVHGVTKRQDWSDFSSVQFSRSVVSDSLWLHGLQYTRPPCPSPTPGACMSITLVMPSNHFILCRPLLLPSIFSSLSVFFNESVLCIRWPKYWSFSFSISPSNEYSGLISFRMDWLDLLAVQGTLKSLLLYHSSKESII